jgi:hypothetical protein
MSWLPTTGDVAKGNAATCELWDSIPHHEWAWSELDAFTVAYIDCAIWASTVDDPSEPSGQDNRGGYPMDRNYSWCDFDNETTARIVRDCKRFQEHAAQLGIKFVGSITHAGYDFWLTRNGHGAGFWDGDWQDEVGEQLTTLSQSFGECDLIVGDDGKVYCE